MYARGAMVPGQWLLRGNLVLFWKDLVSSRSNGQGQYGSYCLEPHLPPTSFCSPSHIHTYISKGAKSGLAIWYPSFTML